MFPAARCELDCRLEMEFSAAKLRDERSRVFSADEAAPMDEILRLVK